MAIAIGYGTTFSWDGDPVGELTRIGPVSITISKQDSTNLNPDDAFKTMLPGLLDPGNVDLEGWFRPGDTGQAGMLADMLSRTQKEFIITFPTSISSSTWTGNAYVIAFTAGDATPEGIVPWAATISITGKPILGVTASTGLTTPFFTISESAVIVPDAAGDVYLYVATVLTGISSVTVTPTATAGVITVQGNVVGTGEASSAITLGAAGSVTLITIVVKEALKSAKTYEIYLTRAAGA